MNPTPLYIALGEKENTDADVSFVNGDKGDLLIVDLDSIGRCKQMDFLSEQEKAMQSILFDADGLPASVVTEAGVVSFANYEGKHVDIAVIKDGDMEVHKAVECACDWDELKDSLRDAAKELRVGAPTRNVITDAALAADKWLREHNQTIVLTFDAIDNALLGANVVSQKTLTAKNMTDAFDSWVVPGLEEALDGTEGGKDYAATIGTVSATKDLLTALVEKSTYGVLKWVLTNYPAIEEKMEDGFYWLFTVLDDNTDNVSLGQGALNSGFGTLKVTMSWNFYADVDVHAIEPSGTHIYYGSKVSYVTGGFLDVDNRAGGIGSSENIFWETPEDGVYTIYIDWYSPSTLNGESGTGNVKLTILNDGKGRTFDVSLGIDDTRNVANVIRPDGTVIDTRSAGRIKLTVPCKKKD